MIKLLVFQPYLKSLGGMERLLYEYLKRTKHKTKVLTWFYNKDLLREFQDFDILEIGILKKFFKGKFLRGISALINSIRNVNLKYEVFLIFSAGLSELLLLRDRQRGIKVIYSHTPLRYTSFDCYKFYYKSSRSKFLFKVASHFYSKIEKKVWKKVDFAIFNSELSRKRALKKNLISKDRTKVIYPGINLKEFHYEEPSDYFLYVARISRAKRQHILIKAFFKLVREHPSYKLYIVGGLEDKKYLLYLLKLIKDLRLNSNVRIFINLDWKNLVKMYSTCLAFIHIPYMEDFGIAPLEAAASGKYIINVYPSGNYELLKKAPGIYWIKERFYEDKMIDEVYKALKYFIKRKEDLIERGKANREYIENLDLSWNRFALEMDKTLESLYKKINR